MPCWKENTIYQVFLKYSSIPKDWVHFYIDSCDICQLKATKKFQEALKPIRSKGFLERFQIDLIDMSHEPGAGFNWIAHGDCPLLPIGENSIYYGHKLERKQLKL